MKTLSLAIALGTAAALGLASPAHAGPTKTTIQTLETPEMSSSQFNSLFKPIAGVAATNASYQFLFAPESGVIRSQVFEGQGDAQGLYAYAYQLAVNAVENEFGEAVHLDSVSYQFNDRPVGTDFLGTGTPTYAYAIKDGPIGGLAQPEAAPVDGGEIRVPTKLSFQAGETVGTIRAQYVDPLTQSQALQGGDTSATYVILSQRPFTQSFVNFQSANPTTGSFASVYAPVGPLPPYPIPEPTTVLAWAGMATAGLLVARVRRNRRDG